MRTEFVYLRFCVRQKFSLYPALRQIKSRSPAELFCGAAVYVCKEWAYLSESRFILTLPAGTYMIVKCPFSRLNSTR